MTIREGFQLAAEEFVNNNEPISLTNMSGEKFLKWENENYRAYRQGDTQMVYVVWKTVKCMSTMVRIHQAKLTKYRNRGMIA